MSLVLKLFNHSKNTFKGIVQIWRRPYLLLPSSWTHKIVVPIFLKWRALFCTKQNFKWKSFQWRSLFFNNPLGLAAGMDKSAEYIQGWSTYGPSFIEVGTVTPEAQKSNRGSTLKKSLAHNSLWNYMGFPNKGVDFVLHQLKHQKLDLPLFISIGKNRDTPIEEAYKDYQYLIKKLYPYASAFVINISSPNTHQLRKLFEPDFFSPFLNAVKESLLSISPSSPLLLKMNPDLSDDHFLQTIDRSEEFVDGWVICNTTRSNKHCGFPDQGGISGQFLTSRSEFLLEKTIQHLGAQRKKRKLIISSGGVMTSQDVHKRLLIGADLVQVYSALVFQGPMFFKKIYKEHPFHSISEQQI